MDDQDTRRAQLSKRIWMATLGAVSVLALALVYDAGGTVVNGVADVFLVCAATLTYQRWRIRRERQNINTRARQALEPMEKFLWSVRRHVDPAHRALQQVGDDAQALDENHKLLWWLDIGFPRDGHDLEIVYDGLRSECPDPTLDDQVDQLRESLRSWSGLLTTFYRVWSRDDNAGGGSVWSLYDNAASGSVHDRIDREVGDLAAEIREHIAGLHQALDAVDADCHKLSTQFAQAFPLQDVTSWFSASTSVPRFIYRAAWGIGAASALVWLGGIWPGDYAADVLDNMLVALTAILAGVAFTTLSERRTNQLLVERSAESRDDAGHAIRTIRTWAASNATLEGRRFNERSGPLVSAEDLGNARAQARVALTKLQHLQPDPVLDAARDTLDELVIAAQRDLTHSNLMNRVESVSERMIQRIEARFPYTRKELCEAPLAPTD